MFYSPFKLRSAYSDYIKKYSDCLKDKAKMIEYLGPELYGFVFGADPETESSFSKFLNENTSESAYTHFSPTISLTTDYIFFDDEHFRLHSVLEVLNSKFLSDNFIGIPN